MGARPGIAEGTAENQGSCRQQGEAGDQKTNSNCGCSPTAISIHAFLRSKVIHGCDQFLIAINLCGRCNLLLGGRPRAIAAEAVPLSGKTAGRCTSQSRPRAGAPQGATLPAACTHWNWRKKLNNYLNILRITKSSDPPGAAESFPAKARTKAAKSAQKDSGFTARSFPCPSPFPQVSSDAEGVGERCRGVAQKWLKAIAVKTQMTGHGLERVHTEMGRAVRKALNRRSKRTHAVCLDDGRTIARLI